MEKVIQKAQVFSAQFNMRETLSYVWVGLVGVGLDGLFFFILREVTSITPTVLTMVSALLAASLTFPLNVYFTFKKTDNLKKRFNIYILVNAFGVVLGGTLMYLGYELIGIDDRIMKLFSIFVVAATQFLLNKFVAFK